MKIGKDVTFKTEDNVKIAATHYIGKGNCVILLHMLSRDRRDWDNFAVKLNSLGYNVLAIDLRGHGESDLDFLKFTSTDYNNMVKDVAAAKKYLNKSKIFVIGASIGANVALNYAVKDKDVKGIVLLSPGADYRGVETLKAIMKYDRPIIIVSSEDDFQSIGASRQLYSFAGKQRELKEYQDAGHGTNMFVKPDLADSIIDWLDKYK